MTKPRAARTFSQRDLSILIGNLLDHFDSALYGFLAPILAPLFFPNHDVIIQLILVYSFMATSVVTRPFGAFIFGMIARKFGPLIAMSYSLTGVAIGAVLIGIIPTYEIMGHWAAILLLTIRFIKGIFAAGENAIVKLYILENKDDAAAFKASYIYQGSSMIGAILASAISALILWMDKPDLWRYCFIAGGIVGFIAYALRLFDDSKRDKLLFQSYEISTLKIFWKHRVRMLSVALTTGLSHITYAIPCVVMNSLMPLISDVTLVEMMELNTLLLIFDMLMIFVAGPILSRFNYLRIIIISTILMMCTIPLLMLFLPGSSIWYISLVRIWIVFLGVIFMCPQNLYYKKLFENSKEQYLLVGMANALGAGIIGRTVPMVSMTLWYMTQSMWSIAVYVGVVAVIVVWLMFIIDTRIQRER